MFINTKYRTEEEEIMDDFEMEGERLRVTLDEIAQINRLLGGNTLTLKGVDYLIDQIVSDSVVTILDIGCGNGDMLRALADFALKKGWKFKLIGVDANLYTVDYARKLSETYQNIEYHHMDIFSDEFSNLEYDIVTCTLILHHFNDSELLKLMTLLIKKSKIGIVVNDLHRSAVAYRLFQLVSFIFRLSEMPSKDGLTSILRGFKKKELETFSKKLTIKNYKIRWKWAFRYQWIIKTV
ncbi:methyltransferase domain-containing protein [Flavobacteriaceae bacterium R38]|nr:methyltransferase domain-containing protein [Flavobacteriaceae bacterium R38]